MTLSGWKKRLFSLVICAAMLLGSILMVQAAPATQPQGAVEVAEIQAQTAADSNNWYLIYGDWNVAADTAIPGNHTMNFLTRASGRAIYTGNPDWNDFILEADVTLTNRNGNGGLMFRSTNITPDTSDGYHGLYVGFSTTTLYLGEVNGPGGPAWTTLTTAPMTTAINQLRHLKIVANARNIQVFVDAETTPIINYTGNLERLSGYIGMHASDTLMKVDNVIVKSLDGTAELFHEDFENFAGFRNPVLDNPVLAGINGSLTATALEKDSFTFSYSVTREAATTSQVSLKLKKYGETLQTIPLSWAENSITGSHTFVRDSFHFNGRPDVNLVGYFDVELVVLVGEEEITITKKEFEAAPRPTTYTGTHDFSHIVGTNFTNSSAVSQLQMWSEFDKWKVQIDQEMGYAQSIGLNSLRVYIHNIPYDNDKEAFLGHIEEFLVLSDQHGIKPTFVFFDDCWYTDQEVFPFTAVFGRHNGRWAISPFKSERTFDNYPKFKSYVQDTIERFKNDDRVLAWTIWNEPENGTEGAPTQVLKKYTRDLLQNSFDWARQIAPKQPIIASWYGDQFSDIGDEHNYGRVGNTVDPVRGTIVTEAGARAYGAENSSYGSATEWVYWLNKQKDAGIPVPAVFLTWELMVGNSMTRYKWGTADNAPEPAIPWCGLFYPGGEAVSLAEKHAIKQYTTGTGTAWLFDDFQDNTITNWTIQSGAWTEPYQAMEAGRAVDNIGEMRSNGGGVILNDAQPLENFTMEASVRLSSFSDKGAGFLLRYNPATQNGYYVGMDTTNLYVDKIVNGVKTNLKTLPFVGNMSDMLFLPGGVTNVAINVRNMLRVTMKNGTISVFVNDPRKAFVKVTDPEYIVSGQVGFAAYGTTDVRFDDFAVEKPDLALELALDKVYLNAGEYFNVETSVTETIASNVVVLDYTFDKSKIAFANYSLPAGVNFISYEPTDTGARLMLMVQDYKMKNIAAVMFQALETLDQTDELFSVVGQFVVIGDAGKEVICLSNILGFDPPIQPDLFDLIMLSNVIDAFGKTKHDTDWPMYKGFDFDQNGFIDIQDVVFVASRIK